MVNDLKMMQIISSRIIHDLSNPLGALGAGIEIIESENLIQDKELSKLVSISLESALARIKFYKIAFTNQKISNVSIKKVESEFVSFLNHYTKGSDLPSISWLKDNDVKLLTSFLGDNILQIYANLPLLSFELYPKCNSLKLILSKSESSFLLTCHSESDSYIRNNLRSDIVEIFSQKESLDYKGSNIQAYMTKRIVELTGGELALTNIQKGISVVASWKI